MKLMLLRHGPVDVPPGLCYGHLEVPLREPSASWLGAATTFVEAHLDKPMQLWSSPSLRALRMAELLAERHPIQSDSRLRELHFGAFEGRCWNTIPLEESLAWSQSDGEQPCPGGGESFVQLRERVSPLLAIWTRQNQNVLCACHAGPIRALLQHILDIPFSKLFSLDIDYASFSLLEYREGLWNIRFLNHTLPNYGATP